MDNRFIANPTNVKLSRSLFSPGRPVHNIFTGNFGDLIPVRIEQAMPGDNWNTSCDVVAQMPALKVPVKDDAYLDTYCFFVPYRTIWTDFEKFLGVADPSSWDEQEPDLMSPTFEFTDDIDPSCDNLTGTLFDYFHFPLVKPGYSYPSYTPLGFDDLVFRAYFVIWNEWFRDQNIDDPILVNKTSNPSTYMTTDLELQKVCRFKDFFTTLLPNPVRGQQVRLPIGGTAPVITGDPSKANLSPHTLSWVAPGSTHVGPIAGGIDYLGIQTKGNANETIGKKITGATGELGGQLVPANLYADLGETAGITVNDLMRLITTQRFMHLAATGGNRFREIILSQYGVSTDESRVDVPEYLGGSRRMLSMQQVLQTSASNDVTPQANPAGHSITGVTGACTTRYAVQEPGLIMWLCCARTAQTWSQGIDRKFIQKKRYDFGFWPVFANLGEEAVYKDEVYYSGGALDFTSRQVLGYQSRYEEYRIFNNQIAGYMRPEINKSLAVYHYGNKLTAAPALNGAFLHETRANVDRTLAVPSTAGVPQLYLDYAFNFSVVRVLPEYAIPDIAQYF